MKKIYFIIILLTLWGRGAFGDAGEQEEIDFLLFLPNSSDQFADADQAAIHLDTVARYLKGRDILPGQIYVYGYAANVTNDIEPINLSLNRALFVIQELKERGIASYLFADPVGYGPVDLWGGNINESDRSPNRRVRILVENIILTPTLVASEEPAAETPPEEPAEEPIEEPIRQESSTEKSHFSFPWWLLLLALLAIIVIIFFASRRKKSAPAKPIPAPVRKAEPPVEPIPVPVQKTEPSVKPILVPVQKTESPHEKIKILEEEEIRLYAYGLYERRYGQNGDTVGDWHQSICELTAYYEARGYRVILYWEQEAQQLR
jgi:hypothetical protein